jgi:hypothetical protein
MIKKTLLTLTFFAAPFACSIAQADGILGLPYGAEVKERGPGKAVKGNWVFWAAAKDKPDTWIQYRSNKAQSIIWHAATGPFPESEIWRMLIETVPTHIYWKEGDRDENGNRYFWSTDNLMTARLSDEGQTFQMCYVAWLDRHAHASSKDQDNDIKPPTEEGDDNEARPKPTPRWLGKGEERL